MSVMMWVIKQDDRFVHLHLPKSVPGYSTQDATSQTARPVGDLDQDHKPATQTSVRPSRSKEISEALPW